VLGRRRLLLPLPFALAEALAASLERLPNPPLTHEEVRLLRTEGGERAADTGGSRSCGVAARGGAAGLAPRWLSWTKRRARGEHTEAAHLGARKLHTGS
jgi:hypothetical protein